VRADVRDAGDCLEKREAGERREYERDDAMKPLRKE
jgi:hypothetical protein